MVAARGRAVGVVGGQARSAYPATHRVGAFASSVLPRTWSPPRIPTAVRRAVAGSGDPESWSEPVVGSARHPVESALRGAAVRRPAEAAPSRVARGIRGEV